MKKRAITVILTVVMVIIAVTGCRSSKDMTISIATKPMIEQYIIGNILQVLIEQETDLVVEMTEGVDGGTASIWEAMGKGEVDIYPEYTGTGWNVVLKKNSLYGESMFEQLKQEYLDKYDMSWMGMYGFNNTYGLVVRKEIAKKYELNTYSDLAVIANQLNFGAEPDFFTREDGYEALCDTYGFDFSNELNLDIAIKYQAIKEKKVDVMNIFNTDGSLNEVDVVVLEDDKGLYPSYMCGNVVHNEVLKAHPELNDVFDILEYKITDEDMARMNHEVESNGKDPGEVAREYLEELGLLK